MNDYLIKDEERLISGIVKLHVKLTALTLGLVGGLILFTATIVLVIKGGDPVGPHLQLLSQYFPGYRVSFSGSFIGFAYGFTVSAICGLLIGWIYNWISGLRKSGP